MVSFAPDGTLSGTAGCRVLTGTYRLDGDDLSLAAFGIEDRACSPNERTRSVAYGLTPCEVQVSDRQLVLHHRDGTRAVVPRPRLRLLPGATAIDASGPSDSDVGR